MREEQRRGGSLTPPARQPHCVIPVALGRSGASRDHHGAGEHREGQRGERREDHEPPAHCDRPAGAAMVVQRGEGDEYARAPGTTARRTAGPIGTALVSSRCAQPSNWSWTTPEGVQRLGHVRRQCVRGRVGRPGQRRDDDQPARDAAGPTVARARARRTPTRRMPAPAMQARAPHSVRVLEGARQARGSRRDRGNRARRSRT